LLHGFCLVLPAEVEKPRLPGSLHTEVEGEGSRMILGVVATDGLGRVRSAAESLGGRCLPVPRWFAQTPGECGALLPAKLDSVNQRCGRLEQALVQLAAKHAVSGALGVLERLKWFLRTAEDISCDEEYCWITGWTSESDSRALNRALSEAGVRPSLRFVLAPRDVPPPSVTRNPIWLQPFELFTRAIGVPGLQEADPTTWVALLVPLLFGYMCGDLGHGLVMVAVGLYLQRRWTWGWLLVFGGGAAAAFGVAYGDVFGFESLLSPLWIRPLDEPLLILVVPVVAGALVLTLGILLHWVESCWRAGESFPWLADLAQLLVYWGIILVLVDPGFGWLAIVGVTLCIVRRILTDKSPQALPSGLGLLFENTFQLLLNTLSFVRVGAFALAHAGLATTVILLAEGMSNTLGAAAILLIGNLLIILLEGTVVSIQATRLILFEFFVRFFEGTGRQFQPATHPPTGESGP
jgi:V/A-type H+-transporting ATPase subunit I